MKLTDKTEGTNELTLVQLQGCVPKKWRHNVTEDTIKLINSEPDEDFS